MVYTEEQKCRVCGWDLQVVYDLGMLYTSGFTKHAEERPKAPLRLARCMQCGLHQLKDTVNLDEMYRQYWYKSSLNSSMVRDLQDVVTMVEHVVNLEDGDVVVDIGTNDGTLLSLYKNENLFKVGYDPAYNLAEEAEKNCDIFYNQYFTSSMYPVDKPKAKVVTAIAMFYDLPAPTKFVNDVKKILADDGVFVIQFTDLTTMLKINAVDNICHEHLEYYTLNDIINLMYTCGLQVFHAEYNNVNGGSLRVFVSNMDKYSMTETLFKNLADEAEFYRSPESTIESFISRIKDIKARILDYVYNTKYMENFSDKNSKIYALAASTKGNTLLQILGLDDNIITAVGEINKDKFGLYTVTGIPIIPEEEVFKNNPHTIIILAWHFQETFERITREYRNKGGLVLFPLPQPLVLMDNGGFLL